MGDFSYKRYAREYSPALFQFVSPEAFEKLDMMEKDIQPSQATVLTCCEGCAEKHTHITSSHHHIVNFGMQNSFFGLPRFLLSLCFWHFKGPFGPQCILLGLFGWPFADAPDHFQTADESHGDGTEGHPPSNAHQYKGRSDDDSNLM